MSNNSKMKVFAALVLIAASCGQADAKRHHRHHIHHTTRVVVCPTPKHHHIVTSRVINRFSQKGRLAMAIAYLNNTPRLTVKQYARITSLNKSAAEAELDAFVLDKNIPICAIVDGKNKVYVIDNVNS